MNTTNQAGSPLTLVTKGLAVPEEGSFLGLNNFLDAFQFTRNEKASGLLVPLLDSRGALRQMQAHQATQGQDREDFANAYSLLQKLFGGSEAMSPRPISPDLPWHVAREGSIFGGMMHFFHPPSGRSITLAPKAMGHLEIILERQNNFSGVQRRVRYDISRNSQHIYEDSFFAKIDADGRRSAPFYNKLAEASYLMEGSAIDNIPISETIFPDSYVRPVNHRLEIPRNIEAGNFEISTELGVGTFLSLDFLPEKTLLLSGTFYQCLKWEQSGISVLMRQLWNEAHLATQSPTPISPLTSRDSVHFPWHESEWIQSPLDLSHVTTPPLYAHDQHYSIGEVQLSGHRRMVSIRPGHLAIQTARARAL